MSDTPLGRMIVELGITDTKFTQGVGGVKAELKSLQNDFKSSQTAFKNFGGQVDGVGHPMTKLNTLIDKQKQYVSQLAEQYKGSLNKETGEATRATDGYARQLSAAKGQLVQYYAQQKQLANQIKISAQEQYKQNSIVPKIANGFDAASKKIDAFGNAMLPASVALTGVFYKGIQSAAEFNGKMTEIQALLADDTSPKQLAKNMDILSSKSKEWARQYGIDTSSINEGIEEMIKKGYDFNQTLGAMPTVLDASKASGDDFNTVMSASTSILEQFGLVSKDTAAMNKNTQRVTDSLAFVANKTAAGFSDMGNAMEYAGPVAHGLGMSLEETSAAIGLMSNNGIEGEKAGTALRGALSRLMKPSDTAADAMGKLGINLEEFKKGQLGLPDILDNIKDSTNGMTKAQKASLLSIAFGTEAQTGMNILVSQGGNALRNLTKETQNATGYTKKLADQMNNSDKNEFAKAKATIETLSIDLGEKLLPSIVPIVKEASNLADGFSKLDPKTQQLLINMGLITAAAYPASKALSGVTSIVGFLPKQMAKWGTLGAGQLALKGIETGAVSATAAIGTGGAGLSGSIGGLAPILAGIGPVGWAALGTAGLAGTIVALSKVTEKARGELQETSDWGTTVGETANDQLKNFENKLENFNSAFSTFESSGTNSANNVKKAFKELAETVGGDIDKAKEDLAKRAEVLGIPKEEIDAWKNNMDQHKNNVQVMSDQVIGIYETASKQKRDLTLEEQEVIKNNEAQIMEAEVNSLQISGDKKAAVQAAIYGKINATSEKQLNEYKAAIEKAVDSENTSYKSSMETLKQSLDAGMISKEEYYTKSKALSDQHGHILDTYGKNLLKVLQQSKDYYQTDSDAAAAWKEKTSKYFKDHGLDYGDISKKMQEHANTVKNTSGLVAKYTDEMSKEGKDASDAWNALVYDPKTGKVTTNAKEKVSEAMQAAGGWQNIQWIEKNANLDTNALITIAEAAQANGMWNNLTPEEKNLTVNNKQGLAAIVNSKENLDTWNKMPVNVKEMLGKNTDFVNKSGSAKAILDAWNALTPKEKELKAKNLTVQPKEEAQRVIDSLRDKRVTLGALNGTIVPTFQAQKTVNSLKGKDVPLTASNNTGSGKNSAQNTMNSLQNVTRGLFANNNTWTGVNTANSTIQTGFNGKIVNLSADGTNATNTYNSFMALPDLKTINIQPHIMGPVNHAQGTPYHQGGLAVVNDQKGPTYKELITLPNGTSFIPQGRDVMLPLPRGSQVLKARETAKLIPKYANGTGGIPQNAKIFQDMNAVQVKLGGASKTSENSELVKVMKEVLTALKSNNPTQNYDPKIEVTLNVEKSSLSKRKVYEDLSQHLGKAMQREMKRRFER
ncbi:phage tail tape measure protein [Lactococcus garvieae]|uniref:phage tail tape measure protein n=1 Tax=Lactococcus garvieae TaxID=1363 RepID=UPI0002FDE4BD|nr:phage tail tape measure protein [Lactococcus garvieae]